MKLRFYSFDEKTKFPSGIGLDVALFFSFFEFKIPDFCNTIDIYAQI
jgi:hypothetical protein